MIFNNLKRQNMINIKTELKEWLVNYITNNIHGFESEDSPEFNAWAKAFDKEEASFVVDMEFINDWGYDERESISEEEATKYAQPLIKRILENWNL